MPGITKRKLKSGKTKYEISQSWLSTALTCPEQARLEMLKELPRRETDATAIGTAMHHGIWAVLSGECSTDDGERLAIENFEQTVETGIEWVQIKTPATAIETVKRVYWTWANEILPQLPHTVGVEVPFTVPLYENESSVVDLKGTIDYIGVEDGNGEESIVLWDWKTANQPYVHWEKQRWAIQPTVYTYAATHMYDQPVSEFNFGICMKQNQSMQVVSVTRHEGDWEFLKEQVQSLIYLIEADLPKWPLRDQHVLCSEKWCPVWTSCKGKHV